MPRFANCVIMDFSTVIMHINIDKKGTKFAKPGNNVKMPRSPRDSSKNAVLVPPKLSSELELRSTFLGQFWRHSDGIFSRITRRTVAFCPKITSLQSRIEYD